LLPSGCCLVNAQEDALGLLRALLWGTGLVVDIQLFTFLTHRIATRTVSRRGRQLLQEAKATTSARWILVKSVDHLLFIWDTRDRHSPELRAQKQYRFEDDLESANLPTSCFLSHLVL
jgi:hypothetical protein